MKLKAWHFLWVAADKVTRWLAVRYMVEDGKREHPYLAWLRRQGVADGHD